MFLWLQHTKLPETNLETINQMLEFHNSPLEIEHFHPNETKRKLFKSFMNSCIGKFAQKQSFPNSTFVRSAEDIDEMVQSGEEITNFTVLGDSICRVETAAKQDRNIPDRKSNPIITAFVTAYSRIDMHRHILKLQTHGFCPIYTDTDSLIFCGPKEKTIPLPTQSIFGHFKEEFKDTELEAFCCIGKKNYALSLKEDGREKTVFKIRGMSFQSKSTSSEISFQDFKRFLDVTNVKNPETMQRITQSRLNTNKTTFEVSKNLVKITPATSVNFHRVLRPKNLYKTEPYGYIKK